MKIRTIRSSCAALAVVGSLCSHAVTLESPAMKIIFGELESGFGVERIVNRLSGDVPFCEKTTGRSLWEVRFSRPSGTTNEMCAINNCSPSASRESKRMDDGIRLYWKGIDLPGERGVVDVAAEVRMISDTASEWRISLRNRSRHWAQHEVEYPILRHVMPSGTGDALLPWKNLGGRLFRDFRADRLPPPHQIFNSPGMYMPVCSFMREGAGLYIAAHDGKQRIKRLNVHPECDVSFWTPLENAGVRGLAAEGPRYPVVVSAFRGDWWQAAHIYRSWATNQIWCAKGKIAFRKDFPKNAAESDLWLNCGVKSTNTYAHMHALWPDVTCAVGASSWYVTEPGNRMNPEFFPAFPQGTNSMAWARSHGIHVMPYVNGRIWDISAAGFAYARRDATVDANGELYLENYPPATFAVMCPACPVWQKIMRNLGRRCLNELVCDMLYYDQVSCSRPRPCYNPAHGHPLGGGSWWADGYRQMFSAIHADFEKRGAAVTSEQLGEAWLDVIDAYLNASDLDRRDVPLFPAVYQGYCIHFGRAIGVDKPHETHGWRFLQDAKTVLWGEAPGWIGPHIVLFPKYRDEAENLRTVAKFRRKHAEFLVYGSLEGEIRFEKPDESVYGTIWQNATGDRSGAAIVNASEAEKTVRFTLCGAQRTEKLPPMRLTWYDQK